MISTHAITSAAVVLTVLAVLILTSSPIGHLPPGRSSLLAAGPQAAPEVAGGKGDIRAPSVRRPAQGAGRGTLPPRQKAVRPAPVTGAPAQDAPREAALAAEPAPWPVPVPVPVPARDAADLPPVLAPDEPETGGGSVDGRLVRSAVATAVVNGLTGAVRPSRLQGESGQASLLGTTLDGFWGLGQAAAIRLIVEGKAPEAAQLRTDALRIVAAAANQELAGLIDEATQYGEDNHIRFLRNLELRAEWFPGERPSLEARTIDALYESDGLSHTLFLEGAVRSDFEDTTLNLGLGYRFLPPGSDWMLGLNAFYDREFPVGHERVSVGVEASTDDVTLFANRYVSLGGWNAEDATLDTRAMSGWDAGISGQLPGVEDLALSLSAFHWDAEQGEDQTGLKLRADYAVNPALRLPDA